MRKVMLIGIAFVLAGVVWWAMTRTRDDQSHIVSGEPIRIVASFYPLRFFAESVAGDMATVTGIVPFGVEPHDYEPTPDEITDAYRANLFVFNGAGIDSWAKKIQPDLAGKGISTLEMTSFFELGLPEGIGEESDECLNDTAGDHLACDTGGEESVDEHDSTGDPHIWIDPVLAGRQIGLIRDALMRIDPLHADAYVRNAETVTEKFQTIDREYREGLDDCDLDVIVSSHNAYGYLANRYGFQVVSLTGTDPEAEPSLRTITSVAERMKSDGIKHVFSEPLESPKAVGTLAAEVGAEVLTLNPIEGLTDADRVAGEDYFSLAKTNLMNLRTALRCQ